MQVAYVSRLAEMAAALGAGIVRVFSGYTTQPESYARDWDACVRALRECARRAADAGVVVGLQNHHDVGAGLDACARTALKNMREWIAD